MKSLYIVDGHSHIFRAYHAVGYLSTSKGVPSHAVLILSSMLWKLIREEQPDYLGITLDPPGPTFRDAMFADYKATRTSMPDDLARQLPYVRRLFEALRTPVVEIPGFEADDVLATLVEQALKLPRSRDRGGQRRQGPAAAGGAAGARAVGAGPHRRARDVRRGQGARALGRGARADRRRAGAHGRLRSTTSPASRAWARRPRSSSSASSARSSACTRTSRWWAASCARRWPPAASRRCCRASWPCWRARRRSRSTSRRSVCVEPDWPRLRGLWMEMEFTRLIKELPATTVAVSAEPVAHLDGAAGAGRLSGPGAGRRAAGRRLGRGRASTIAAHRGARPLPSGGRSGLDGLGAGGAASASAR